MTKIGYIGKSNRTNAIILRMLRDNFQCEIHTFAPQALTEKEHTIAARELNLFIIDLHTIPGNAVQTIKTLNSLLPGTPTLVLDIHKEYKLVKILMEEGANGYLTITTSERELTSAVNALIKGDTYISSAIDRDQNEK